MEYIQITDSNKEVILELFRKAEDKEGFLIDSVTKKRLICPYSQEPIKASSFSILPGSATFVNNKFYCFAEHIISHKSPSIPLLPFDS